MADYEQVVKERERELELAIYFAKGFIEELGREKALQIIEKAWEKYWIDNINRRLEDVPPEGRLQTWGDYLKVQSEERPWWKIVEVSPKRVCVEILKCPTYDVCEKHGVPELCQKSCDSDFIKAKAIHPKVKLVRDKEIAYGAEICNHCYIMEG
jgi:hypothetical protein